MIIVNSLKSSWKKYEYAKELKKKGKGPYYSISSQQNSVIGGSGLDIV